MPPFKSSILAFSLIGLLAIGSLVAVRYNQYRRDPLVAGVPPKANSDGTFDYTIFGAGTEKPGSAQREILEWVLRLRPEYVRGALGTEDMTISGAGVSASSKGRPNVGYQIWLTIPDLKPTESGDYGKGSVTKDDNGFILFLKTEYADYNTTNAAELHYLQQYCQDKGINEQGLNAFGGDPSTGKKCYKQTENVLWSDVQKRMISGVLECRDDPSFLTCDITIYFKNKILRGFMNRKNSADFAKLVPRLTDFLNQATVVDHVYTGEPNAFRGDK